MSSRPSKPWRVTVIAESEHDTAAKAYTAARTALAGDEQARNACVEEWEDGRWRHYETLYPENVNAQETT